MKHPLGTQAVDCVDRRMVPNLTQIRQALKLLAERKGRPDYELCTVKEVKCALEHGLEHHLIVDVLPLIEAKKRDVESVSIPKGLRISQARLVKQRHYPTKQEEMEIVRWINQSGYRLIDIAEKAGCGRSTISHIKNGRNKFTLDIFNKIKKARKQLEGVAA